jgi:hypothetical protein
LKHNVYDYITGALWKDENFDVASYRATGAAPPDVITIPGTSINTVSFDGGGTTEEIHVCKELNHDYQESTPISFHVHWYPTDTGAGNVKWQLQYWCANSAIPGTVVSGLMSTVQAAVGTAWIAETISFPDLDLGTLAKIGTQIHFRFFRNPSDDQDTYNADAAVATMGYHYLTNSRGSSKMTSK